MAVQFDQWVNCSKVIVQGMCDPSMLTEEEKDGKRTLYTKPEKPTSGSPKRSDEMFTTTTALVQLQHECNLLTSSQSHPTKHFEPLWVGLLWRMLQVGSTTPHRDGNPNYPHPPQHPTLLPSSPKLGPSKSGPTVPVCWAVSRVLTQIARAGVHMLLLHHPACASRAAPRSLGRRLKCKCRFLLCKYQTLPMETHHKEVKEPTRLHGWNTKGSQIFGLTSWMPLSTLKSSLEIWFKNRNLVINFPYQFTDT